MANPEEVDLDLEIDDEFTPDPAMAAMLGFSTFGAQPSKRKKYNDAVVDITTTAPAMKGANAQPLGTKRKASHQGPPDSAPTKKPTTLSTQHARPPSTSTEAVAEIVDNAREAADTTSASRPPLSSRNPVAEDLLKPWDVSTQGPRQFSGAELQALREGVFTSNRHVAYFLPSFLEDPWAKL